MNPKNPIRIIKAAIAYLFCNPSRTLLRISILVSEAPKVGLRL